MIRFPISKFIFCQILQLYALTGSAQSLSGIETDQFGKPVVNVAVIHGYPSAAANMHSVIAGVVAEQPYLMEGIRNYFMAVGLPVSFGNLALLLQHQGHEWNRYQKFSISYARTLHSKLDIGARFNYHHERFTGYQSVSVFSGSLGFGFALHSKFSVTAGIHDPRFFLAGQKRTFRIGSSNYISFNYSLANHFSVGCQLLLPEEEQATCRLDMCYSPGLECRIFLGINTVTNSFRFGLSYSRRGLTMLFNMGFHPVLGPVPAVGILYDYENAKL